MVELLASKVAWSGLVCASRVVGIDRLNVGSYIRFQHG